MRGRTLPAPGRTGLVFAAHQIEEGDAAEQDEKHGESNADDYMGSHARKLKTGVRSCQRKMQRPRTPPVPTGLTPPANHATGAHE